MILKHIRNVMASLSVALAILIFQTAPGSAATCEAASFVQSAGQAYDRAASARSASAFASAASRYSDLRSLSFFALGKHRKALPKEREAEYLALTRKFIGEFMLENGSGFRASNLEIVECSKSGSNTVVTARLSSGGKVVFRVAGSGGRYKVSDINMKGIWVVQQMRSTFVGTINRTGSIDGLLEYLKS
jgi:ABC-type transporter MlaC component